MDEVPPVVFETHEEGEAGGEIAMIVDRGDAPVLRDALAAAAKKAHRRNPTMRHAARRREREIRVLAKYVERFEQVRLAESERFVRRMQEREAEKASQP